MTTELYMLICSIILGLVHNVATGQATTLQHGIAYGLGPRDEKKQVTGIGGRIQRAFANYMETFPFFAAAVLIAQALDRHNWMTIRGAELYFWSRLAFPVLYAFNVTGIRTLAYGAAMLGIVLILIGLT